MRQLPNLITALRMLLTVPLAWLIRAGRYDAALAVALVAGFSDAFDGFLAKRFGWQSWIGGILDPLADKLLLTGAFVSLAVAGAIPIWLAALVVGRDLVIVLGATAYHHFVGPIQAQPTRLSKLTTGLQIALVLAVLLHLSRFAEWSPTFIAVLQWAVAAATLASELDYVVRWSLKARRAVRDNSGADSR